MTSGKAIALAGFFRSGTAHRVRIALNLKGIAYRYEAISLPQQEHRTAAFLDLNPQGLVPVLTVEGQAFTQSPAILEWLEETYPEPPLLPTDREGRQRVRAMASLIGCDIHPINNLRVLNELRRAFAADEEQVSTWCRLWIGAGFSALETLLGRDATRAGFCFGSRPTLADCYLIPQVFSARRFALDLAPFPAILEIDKNCASLVEFADAAPDRQPDAGGARNHLNAPAAPPG